MSTSLHALQGFASADEHFSAAGVASLVRARTERVAALVLKYFGRRLEREPGLTEMVATLPDKPLGVVWPAVGPLRRALLEQPLDPERAVRAARAVAPLLAPRSEFVLRSALPEDAPELAVEADAGRTIEARYASAYDTLARFAPSYHAWVVRSIHAIVPVATREGTTTSSSFEYTPGVIALSHVSPTLAIADALVHEASHQHLFLLASLGPLHDGSDTRLYWSPARRAERPLDKILLAYHAFANVFLFFRQCRENGHEDAAICEAQENDYRGCLEALAGPLETTTALTPLGRSLFKSLASMVEERSS